MDAGYTLISPDKLRIFQKKFRIRRYQDASIFRYPVPYCRVIGTKRDAKAFGLSKTPEQTQS